jgi:hypothetical protein
MKKKVRSKLLKRIHKVDFKNRNNLIWKNDWTLETYPIEASNEKNWQKKSIKTDGQNHHMENKRKWAKGKSKERSKDVQPTGTKERREQLSHPQPFMSLAYNSRDLIIIEGLK